MNLGSSPFGGGLVLSGSYTFNPATPNTGGPLIGTYNNTISNLTFQLGTYNGLDGASAPQKILVADNLPFVGDGYMVASSFSGANVNVNRAPVAFELDLTGGTTAFSNTFLPTTPPTISAFANPPTFRVIFTGGVNSIARGTLNSLTAVLLPPAVILFGAGIIALVGLGAGSWRLKKNSFA